MYAVTIENTIDAIQHIIFCETLKEAEDIARERAEEEGETMAILMVCAHVDAPEHARPF